MVLQDMFMYLWKTKKRQQKLKEARKEKEVLKDQRIRSRKNTVSTKFLVTVKPIFIFE